MSEPDWIFKYDVQTCSKESICFMPGSYFTDLAFHPDGNLYGVNPESQIGSSLYLIDLNTCSSTKKITLPFKSNGLVCDINGVFYGGLKDFYSFNIKTNFLEFLGEFPGDCNCDFFFYSGDVYTTFGYDQVNGISGLFKVNLSNPLISEFIIDNTAFLGSVSIPYSCDSTIILGIGSMNTLETSSNDPFYKLFSVDIENKTGVLLCSNDLTKVLGATSPLEFLASDPECDLLLDLDRDNSSGVYPYDFRNEAIVCTENKITPIVDDDLFLHTSAFLDSIVISLTGDLDSDAEGLTLDSSLPDALLSYQNGRYLLALSGDRSDEAWRTALKAIRYAHTGDITSAGVRTLTIIAYNSIKSNQAQCFIRIGERAYAGKDTTLLVCAKQKVDGVSFLLKGQTGGTWQPTLINDVYDPSTDNESVYHYIVHSPECGNDTAVLNIQKLPNRTLDLGPDVSLCHAESHFISTPVQPGDEVLWSDGSTEAERTLTESGNYFVDITTLDGCIISDTINISRSYVKIPKAISIDLCDGDTYTYNGIDYTPGQSITDSIPASSGCDTLITITLRSIPSQMLFRDTFTCDNATLFIQNVPYNVGDTIVRYKPAVTGCDTLIKTVYQSHTLPQFIVTVEDEVLCEGKTTTASASPSTNIRWSTGETKNEVTLSSGNYAVSFTDDKGCIQSKSITIQFAPVIPYGIDIKMPDCDLNNGSIRIVSENLSELFEISINDIPATQGMSDNLGAGNYIISIMNKYGCIIKDTFILLSINEYSVSMTDEITIDKMKLRSLAYTDSGGTTDTILFSPDTDIRSQSDSILILGVEDRVYSITFVDENGCIYTRSLKVNVLNPESAIILPNVITSTGSEDNRHFYLKSTGVTYDMSIYDRWGNQIYTRLNLEGGNIEGAWTPEKSKVQPGVYIYLLTIHTPEGNIQKVGTVTVI
ncbi:MAG: gliding motility-associated C-terminal domain-containing protein [Saprospiraceae bacterium]|nr:gliding motility-associated C-terminal domain-containing protein [Saprospiraceae bacterium]